MSRNRWTTPGTASEHARAIAAHLREREHVEICLRMSAAGLVVHATTTDGVQTSARVHLTLSDALDAVLGQIEAWRMAGARR